MLSQRVGFGSVERDPYRRYICGRNRDAVSNSWSRPGRAPKRKMVRSLSLEFYTYGPPGKWGANEFVDVKGGFQSLDNNSTLYQTFRVKYTSRIDVSFTGMHLHLKVIDQTARYNCIMSVLSLPKKNDSSIFP